jgi:hypothetical protein
LQTNWREVFIATDVMKRCRGVLGRSIWSGVGVAVREGKLVDSMTPVDEDSHRWLFSLDYDYLKRKIKKDHEN